MEPADEGFERSRRRRRRNFYRPLLFDAETRAFRTAKVPSQRGDKSAGFMQGVATIGEGVNIGSIVHGTTVGTNTLLERRGPKIGVITTSGFRDVLEMRRRDRRRTWGLWGDFTPIVDRDLRVEVDERTLADGSIRQPVDEAAVRKAALALRQRGAEALAIIFINSYANPDNERKALVAARSVWDNEFVSASYQVLPEIREFERSSTTALNSYLQPVVSSYLGKLEQALARQRFEGQFYIVQSNGGVMSTATARRFPVRTALSGPAAGVIAAAPSRVKPVTKMRSPAISAAPRSTSPLSSAAKPRLRRKPRSISGWSFARR